MLSSNEGKVSVQTVRQWKQFLKITARRLPRLDSLGDSRVSARKRKSIFLLRNNSFRVKDLLVMECVLRRATLTEHSIGAAGAEVRDSKWQVSDPCDYPPWFIRVRLLSVLTGMKWAITIILICHTWQVGGECVELARMSWSIRNREGNQGLSWMSYELFRLWVGSGANKKHEKGSDRWDHRGGTKVTVLGLP